MRCPFCRHDDTQVVDSRVSEDGAPEDRGNNKLAGYRHLALRVDSIAVARAELEKRGVTFSVNQEHTRGGTAFAAYNGDRHW